MTGLHTVLYVLAVPGSSQDRTVGAILQIVAVRFAGLNAEQHLKTVDRLLAPLVGSYFKGMIHDEIKAKDSLLVKESWQEEPYF